MERKEAAVTKKPVINGSVLVEVRCTYCGRFFGFTLTKDGLTVLLCKNCKHWSIIAEGPTFEGLTTKEIYDMLSGV